MPGITGGIAAGGQGLGNAHGTITLDTSGLSRGVTTARQAGKQVGDAFGQIDAAAKKSQAAINAYNQEVNRLIRSGGLRAVAQEGASAWRAYDAELGNVRGGLNATGQATNTLAQSIRNAMGGIVDGAKRAQAQITSLRGELAALALGAGLLTRIAVGTAAGFQDATTAITGMVGSIGRARTVVEDLRKQATLAGLPFSDMLSVATQLLPTFQGNTEELEKWYDIVRRVSVLNPGARGGLEGAAFSLREAIVSGGTDLISLAERFNISRVQIRQALQETSGDFRAAMDIVLERMGITSEVAEELAKNFNASFRVARDAALQFLAEGFKPILEFLTPLLQQSAQWLSQMRETHPELANLSAGLLSVVTVGAPALLLINQLALAWERLGRTSRAVTLGGLAIAAAPSVGLGLGNVVNRVRGEQPVTMEEINQRLRNVIFNWTVTVIQWEIAIKRGINGINTTVNTWQMGMLNGLAGFLRGLASILPAGLGGNAITAGAVGLENQAIRLGNLNQRRTDDLDSFISGRFRDLNTLGQRLNIEGFRPPSGPTDDGGRAAMEAAVNQEIVKAKVAYVQQVQQIERDANNARIEATQQYEQQRSQIIAQYELNIAREAEDFARNRLRQEQQLVNQIATIRADAADREAEWWADLQEKIAEINEDGNERIAEIEADYQKNRQRRERDHRDTLFQAAGRLDAVAVLNEQKRYARQLRDDEEAHSERIEKERKRMAEQIADAEKAHQRRVEDARRADERRIEDLRKNLAESQRLEDEDRRIRLQRQAEDHTNQLAQMATAHAERLAQISRQEAEALREAEEAHLLELQELKVHNENWLKIQTAQQEASLKLWDKWWEQLGKRFEQFGPVQWPATQWKPTQIPGFASGGWVNQTGPALLHAGEFILNKHTTSALSAMMGGMSQQRLVGAMVGANRSISVGDINVYGVPGMDVNDLARAVRNELTAVFQELTN